MIFNFHFLQYACIKFINLSKIYARREMNKNNTVF